VQKCDVSVGDSATAFTSHLFQHATDPALKQVYQKLIVPNLNDMPKSAMEGLQRICEDSHYAFAAEELSASSSQPTCEITSVPYALIRTPASMIVSKNSPYRRLFSH
jgi:hypothetical protein